MTPKRTNRGAARRRRVTVSLSPEEWERMEATGQWSTPAERGAVLRRALMEWVASADGADRPDHLPPCAKCGEPTSNTHARYRHVPWCAAHSEGS